VLSDILYPADTGKKWKCDGTVHQLFIYLQKAYDSVRREELYNILIEFAVQRKLAGLIKLFK
jgi:hypothetical protein